MKLEDLTFFESIKDLPEWRYNEFQNYLIQESGIGNNIEQVNDNLANVEVCLFKKDYDNAIKEIVKLKLSCFTAFNNINFNSLAFCCLVKTIKGKEYDDINEIKELIKNIKVKDIEETISKVKKN